MLIEAVDDSVLGLCVLTIIIMVATAHVAYQNRPVASIHEANVEAVNEARERLRAEQNARQPPTNGNDTCPICLSAFEFACQTNCGHYFCGLCILAYHDQVGQGFRAMTCPCCRTRLDLLIPAFTVEERLQSEQNETREQVSRRLHIFNRRFSNEPRTMWEQVRDSPNLVWRLFHDLFSGSGFVMLFYFRVVFLLLAMVCYLLSPFDVIPERVFGVLGLVDDMFLFMVFFVIMSSIYRSELLRSA
eukprot:Colp12_sorted_trinity150504_noHs@13106